MEFIEKEERNFMGEQMEKSLRQISGELEVIIEGESLSAFLTIKEELQEKPKCPFCGTTERKWFGLRFAEDSPKVSVEWHYDIEASYNSPYVGQRLWKAKPLIENFIDTYWY